MNAIAPEVVLYHSSKDGSLIRLLQAALRGTEVVDPAEPAALERKAEEQAVILPAQNPALSIIAASPEGEIPPRSPRGPDPVPYHKIIRLQRRGANEAEVAHAPAVEPWQDRDASIARVVSLARELKVFCTSPKHHGLVREILRLEKVCR